MNIDYSDLQNFQVHKLPGTAYYIPNYIDDDEEKYLLEKIYAAPKPKWKDLSNRRLQNWGGLPHPKGMIQEPLPDWLKWYSERIYKLGIFEDKQPNHVLVNEYRPGQGIMPHEDGNLFYPTITTINIGSHTVLDYYSKIQEHSSEEGESNHKAETNLGSRYIGSLLLERRSLLLVQDGLYHNYLHGIKEQEYDVVTDDIANISLCSSLVGDTLPRETRISLTIRHVPKTLKVKLPFTTNF